MVGIELIGHVKNMAKLPSFSFTFSGGNWDEKYHHRWIYIPNYLANMRRIRWIYSFEHWGALSVQEVLGKERIRSQITAVVLLYSRLKRCLLEMSHKSRNVNIDIDLDIHICVAPTSIWRPLDFLDFILHASHNVICCCWCGCWCWWYWCFCWCWCCYPKQ